MPLVSVSRLLDQGDGAPTRLVSLKSEPRLAVAVDAVIGVAAIPEGISTRRFTDVAPAGEADAELRRILQSTLVIAENDWRSVNGAAVA